MHFCVPPLSGLPGRKCWVGWGYGWSRARLLKWVSHSPSVLHLCCIALFLLAACQDFSTTPSGLRQRWASLSKSAPVTVEPLPTSGDPDGAVVLTGAPVLPVRALQFPSLPPDPGLPPVLQPRAPVPRALLPLLPKSQPLPAPSLPAPASRWSGLLCRAGLPAFRLLAFSLLHRFLCLVYGLLPSFREARPRLQQLAWLTSCLVLSPPFLKNGSLSSRTWALPASSSRRLPPLRLRLCTFSTQFCALPRPQSSATLLTGGPGLPSVPLFLHLRLTPRLGRYRTGWLPGPASRA